MRDGAQQSDTVMYFCISLRQKFRLPYGRKTAESTMRRTIAGFRRLRLAGCMAAASSLLLSCGTAGHATLVVSAPSNVTANAPFNVTVTAMYQGKVDTEINGPIHFTTSDQAAHLPTLYVFTAADAGVHTFSGLTLVTPGDQTINVSDYDATPIAGSASVTVVAGP